MSFISSPLPCFRPSKTTDDHNHPPPSQPLSGNPNLTTYIYQTDAGSVSLTWSRSILGCTLHLLHYHHHPFNSSSFSLHIKPFTFWNKHGSKKLSDNTLLFWNLSKARFGSGPEPQSRFYVALVVDHELILLIGDIDARARCRAREPQNPQALLLKREHVDIDARDRHGAYRTRASIGGKVREIAIEIEIDFERESYKQNKNNSRVCFLVDGESVLEVKRLKWKFRGNERLEVDGVPVQISWDMHDWLFDEDSSDNTGEGRAVFMFKFEENGVLGGEQNLCSNWKLGSSGELGKTGSSSSLSISSSAGSFGGSSSVLEWSSVEENELVVPLGFSLIVYAWKR